MAGRRRRLRQRLLAMLQVQAIKDEMRRHAAPHRLALTATLRTM